VTGLEAANLVIQQCRKGINANILPIEPDEPHIQVARTINQTIRHFSKAVLPDIWLP
jgi:hypothetical protein